WVFPEVPPSWDATLTRAELVQADIDEVDQSCAAINRIAPFVFRQIKIKYLDREIKARMQGTTPDYQHIRNHFVDSGRCFGPIETDTRRPVCVLGRDLLRDLNTDDGIVGSPITLMGKQFQVIGILEKKGSFLGE